MYKNILNLYTIIHFILYFIISFYYPNKWVLIIIISIVWEILELLLHILLEKKLKYKVFDEVVDDHILKLSNMKKITEINNLLNTYVSDNLKTLCTKLGLGRKFNDNKQDLKNKVTDYFISKNKIKV